MSPHRLQPSFVPVLCVTLMVSAGSLQAQSPAVRVDTLYVTLGGGVAGRIDTLSVRGSGGPADERVLAIPRPRGTPIAYAFHPDAGFQNVQVRLAERPAPASGSVALDGSQFIRVSVDRIVRVDGRNKRLYDLIRAELTASDVVMAAKRITCEESHLFAIYSDSVAVHLIDDAEDLAVDPIQDAKALERVDRALNGLRFTAGCDTVPARAAAPKPPAR